MYRERGLIANGRKESDRRKLDTGVERSSTTSALKNTLTSENTRAVYVKSFLDIQMPIEDMRDGDYNLNSETLDSIALFQR